MAAMAAVVVVRVATAVAVARTLESVVPGHAVGKIAVMVLDLAIMLAEAPPPEVRKKVVMTMDAVVVVVVHRQLAAAAAAEMSSPVMAALKAES